MEAPEPSRIAFGIMCKAPIIGASKTRLCPPLTPAEAAQLSRCFIADVAAALDSVPAEVDGCGIAVYTPAGEESAFEGLLPQRFGMLLQRGADLGERLLGATEDRHAFGRRAAVRGWRSAAPRGPSMRGFQFSVRRESRYPVPAAIDRAHRRRQYAAFGG